MPGLIGPQQLAEQYFLLNSYIKLGTGHNRDKNMHFHVCSSLPITHPQETPRETWHYDQSSTRQIIAYDGVKYWRIPSGCCVTDAVCLFVCLFVGVFVCLCVFCVFVCFAWYIFAFSSGVIMLGGGEVCAYLPDAGVQETLKESGDDAIWKLKWVTSQSTLRRTQKVQHFYLLHSPRWRSPVYVVACTDKSRKKDRKCFRNSGLAWKDLLKIFICVCYPVSKWVLHSVCKFGGAGVSSKLKHKCYVRVGKKF